MVKGDCWKQQMLSDSKPESQVSWLLSQQTTHEENRPTPTCAGRVRRQGLKDRRFVSWALLGFQITTLTTIWKGPGCKYCTVFWSAHVIQAEVGCWWPARTTARNFIILCHSVSWKGRGNANISAYINVVVAVILNLAFFFSDQIFMFHIQETGLMWGHIANVPTMWPATRKA